eukprot:TRINITY_DN2942_c0_g1_i18.p1 TRINITY_DN2942_c0_g1~~TRINITY_DN2942_c0_g1_i18.p1  ORF type:complete len:181 (-),score=51.10 TRINITY_DN2942_c0_g1_i18:594-1136(-)
MKELFTMCDTDGDGELTKIELGKVMKDLGMVFNDNELETMFHQLDTDNNGSVSCVEFVRGLRFMEKSRRLAKVADKRGIKRENSVSAFVEMLSEEQVEEMHKLFQMIDKNNDGIIVKRELAQVMKEMGLSPTKEVFFFITLPFPWLFFPLEVTCFFFFWSFHFPNCTQYITSPPPTSPFP